MIVSKRTRRTFRPELILAPGPAHMGQPGAGTLGELYGHAWALVLYKDGPQLLQQVGETWEPREDPDALVVLVQRGVRHVTLAWDQAARPVIAWELAGLVYVRQWSPQAGQFVTRGPWPGCDPVLLTDSAAGVPVGNSDVVLFHLSADRLSVVARVQRELYAAPHALHALPAPGVLDQVTPHPWAVQLLGTDQAGTPWALLSDLYPVEVGDTSASSIGGPPSGVLLSTLFTVPVTDTSVSSISSPPSGALLSTLFTVTVPTDTSTRSIAGPPSGALLVALFSVTIPTDTTASSTSGPPSGALFVALFTVATKESAASSISGPPGGSLVIV